MFFKIRRIITISIITCLIILGSLVTFAFQKISKFGIGDLVPILENQLGLHVTLKKVTPKWAGINLIMRLDDLVCSTSSLQQEPIFTAAALVVKLNFWHTITSMDLRFSRIALIKPIVVTRLQTDLQPGGDSALNIMLQSPEFTKAKQFFGSLQEITIENAKIMLVDDPVRPFVLTLGSLDYAPKIKNATIKITDLQFSAPEIFDNDLKIPHISGKLIWQQLSHGLGLNLENVIVALPTTKLKLKLGCSYIAGKFSIQTLHAISDAIDVITAKQYIPRWILPKELVTWLDTAIKRGTILSNSIVYNHGRYNWLLNFNDVTLAYAPNWPELVNLNGNLQLTDQQITIVGLQGKLLDIPIAMTTATVTGLAKPQSFPLVIDTEINTNIPAGIKFLLASPLHNLGKILAPYQIAGLCKLGLQLQIPMRDTSADGVKILGKLALQNASLLAPGYAVPLSTINGNIEFTENIIKADNITLDLLQQPATAKIVYNTAKHKFINIILDTTLSSEAIAQLLPSSIQIPTSGSANFKIKLDLPVVASVAKMVTLISDLRGLAINLPGDLAKEQQLARILQIKLKDKQKAHTIAAVKYGELITAKFAIIKDQLAAGKIILGKTATLAKLNLDQKNLQIAGNLANCNVKQWLDLFNKLSSGVAIPIQYDLAIALLDVFSVQFNTVAVRYDPQDKKLVINAKDINGVLRFVDLPKKEIIAYFRHLNLNTATAKDLTSKFEPENLVAVQFKCKQLILRNTDYGEVKFKLDPSKYSYGIQDLTITNNNFNLAGNGIWHIAQPNNSSLHGTVTSKNFGDTLRDWGLGNSVKQGAGKINFDFRWPGTPIAFKLANVTGTLNCKLAAGKITGVNPGLGRVLGLLSLDNIQRRLKLDFSDFLGSGFTFDNLQADIVLRTGKLNATQIFVDGPSANISLTGDADLDSKAIACKMAVLPKVGASLPVAAAITAGNPAVGAVVWLFNKATNKANSFKTNKYRYHIAGTWEHPQIYDTNNKTLTSR